MEDLTREQAEEVAVYCDKYQTINSTIDPLYDAFLRAKRLVVIGSSTKCRFDEPYMITCAIADALSELICLRATRDMQENWVHHGRGNAEKT